MVTLVFSRAHAFALGWLRATGDRRVQDGEAAVTGQLIETYKTQWMVGRPQRTIAGSATSDTRLFDGRETRAALTGLPAGLTVSTVTRILAAVEAAAELVAADQGALVLHVLDGQTETSDTRSVAQRCPKDHACADFLNALLNAFIRRVGCRLQMCVA